jgi:hypothetical protein
MQPTVRTVMFGLLALAGAAVTWYFIIRFMIDAGGTNGSPPPFYN